MRPARKYKKVSKQRNAKPRANRRIVPKRSIGEVLAPCMIRMGAVAAGTGRGASAAMGVLWPRIQSIPWKARCRRLFRHTRHWLVAADIPGNVARGGGRLAHALVPLLRRVPGVVAKGLALAKSMPARWRAGDIQWRQLAPQAVRFFDPRRVRLEEPTRFRIHSMGITVAIASLIVCAVAMAGTTGTVVENAHFASSETIESAAPTGDQWFADNAEPPGELAGGGDQADTAAQVPVKREEAAAAQKQDAPPRPANFYDPLYVFTEVPAEKVNVYPLANPPGIVVDIPGMAEPAESAVEMVGEDRRVQRVKRLVTRSGIRYILRLSDPVKRIESNVEGNVITVMPRR